MPDPALLGVEGMWYSPESLALLASLFLVSPDEPHRTSSSFSAIAARAARVAACEARVPSLPDSIVVSDGLQPIVRSALEYSPTFRQQCRELAAAPRLRATIRFAVRPTGTTARALTKFRQNRAGAIAADVELRSSLELTELLAHELEHVLEQVEGVDLSALSRLGEARRLTDGAFETARAVSVGQRVAAEVIDNAPDRVRSTGVSVWRGLRRAVSGERRVAPDVTRHE